MRTSKTNPVRSATALEALCGLVAGLLRVTAATAAATATTNASGVASFTIPNNKVSKSPVPIRAEYLGNTNYLGSIALATAFRT